MRNMTLQQMIEQQGLGLQEAAAAAGVGRTSLWRWCNGHATPMWAQAACLAEVLGVDADAILRACERSAGQPAARS